MNLFERVGQRAGASAIVDALYDRVLADPELAPFFAGYDVAAIRRHQVELVISAVGGPANYQGRSIREVHEDFAIEPHHLDLLSGHLDAALIAVGVSPTDAAVLSELVNRFWYAQFW